jgi:hypothetical protein
MEFLAYGVDFFTGPFGFGLAIGMVIVFILIRLGLPILEDSH